jgi:hypothetical protein
MPLPLSLTQGADARPILYFNTSHSRKTISSISRQPSSAAVIYQHTENGRQKASNAKQFILNTILV